MPSNHALERSVTRRYAAEFKGNAAVAELRQLGRGQVVTLLFGSRELKRNHALVLQALPRGKRVATRRTARR